MSTDVLELAPGRNGSDGGKPLTETTFSFSEPDDSGFGQGPDVEAAVAKAKAELDAFDTEGSGILGALHRAGAVRSAGPKLGHLGLQEEVAPTLGFVSPASMGDFRRVQVPGASLN